MGEETAVDADIISAGDTTAIMHLGGLNIPYTDLDNTAEWHIAIRNTQATTHLAGYADVTLNFRPEYPA